MSTMKSAQTSYYGPNSSIYPSVGSVSSGETVTALWYEGSWTFIQYNVTGTTNKKRGYVLTSAITVTESIPTITVTSVTKTTNSAATVYTGPASSGYATAGPVANGENVVDLGQPNGNFTFIEYNITNTSQKKRGYINTDYLGSSGGSATDKIYKDPITKSVNFTKTNHTDYAVKKGTAVYAMCDGTFQFAYWLARKVKNGPLMYVSLGIGGLLYPADGWAAADKRKAESIEYGHLQSLNGYTCPSFSTYAENSAPSDYNLCIDYKKYVIASKNVKCGDLIGYSGDTGNSYGAHLHILLK